MKLRPYQSECNRKIREALTTYGTTLAVLATGLGKSVLFAHAVKDWPGRSLVLAHRDELIRQAAEKVEIVTGEAPGIEMGDERSDEDGFRKPRVVVSSVQTLCRPRRQRRFKPEEFGLLVIDEAHHAIARTYRDVIAYFRQEPSLRVLGLTATPKRADQLAMGQVFESVCFDYGIEPAVNDGWLVPVRQQAVVVEGLDFSNLKSIAGDFSESELEAILKEEKVLHATAAPTVELVGDLSTIVFCASVQHARLMAEVLRRYKSQSAVAVDGTTPLDQRRDAVKAFRSGDVQFLCNCGLFLEGFDAPNTAAIVMARPTKSLALYAQCLGRGTRPLPGVVDGLETPQERKEAIRASLKPCIAEGQLVLTDHGLVPIEAVTLEMKVWDGVDFVSHSGSVCRGVKDTITYCGLTATVDHEVWTEEGWKAFGQCAAQQTPISVAGIGRQAVREADGLFRRDRASEGQGTTADGVQELQPSWVEGLQWRDAGNGWLPEMRTSAASAQMARQSRHGSETSLRQSEGRPLSPLRRARDRVPVLLAADNGHLGTGEPRASQGVVARQEGQQRTLRARKPEVHDTTASDLQSASANEADQRDDACVQTGTSRDSLRRPDVADAHVSRVVGDGDHRSLSPEVQQTKRRVWDILDAGPRHRFTVEGLLVSNCMTVLDFVGNSGRHKIISASDLLGGKYGEPVRQYARKTQAEEGKAAMVDESLERASDELALLHEIALDRRREEIRARAEFHAREVSPFGRSSPGHVFSPVSTAPESERATDKQVWYLVKRVGWARPAAARLSKRQASAIISKHRGSET